tara:strand:- start:53 stop:226 length:174 start_codon:yes stop_codon:yes gene_type:complete
MLLVEHLILGQAAAVVIDIIQTPVSQQERLVLVVLVAVVAVPTEVMMALVVQVELLL